MLYWERISIEDVTPISLPRDKRLTSLNTSTLESLDNQSLLPRVPSTASVQDTLDLSKSLYDIA